MSIHAANPPSYVALAHVTLYGEIELLKLLDNTITITEAVDFTRAPQWLLDRVALLRMCYVGMLINNPGSVVGRKYTDFVVAVYLTFDEYEELRALVIKEVEPHGSDT